MARVTISTTEMEATVPSETLPLIYRRIIQCSRFLRCPRFSSTFMKTEVAGVYSVNPETVYLTLWLLLRFRLSEPQGW